MANSSLTRKLKELESNVLPDNPEETGLLLKNPLEIELSDRAEQIKAEYRTQVRAIIENPALTIEQQEQAAKELWNKLSPEKQAIIDKAHDFTEKRIIKLLVNYFSDFFPKNNENPWLRTLWFFMEMRKLGNVVALEDCEWNHNRDEEDSDFDDNAWWAKLDVKIKAMYPDGVFSEKSMQKLRDQYDEMLAKGIGEYFHAHPEEFERLQGSLKDGLK